MVNSRFSCRLEPFDDFDKKVIIFVLIYNMTGLTQFAKHTTDQYQVNDIIIPDAWILLYKFKSSRKILHYLSTSDLTLTLTGLRRSAPSEIGHLRHGARCEGGSLQVAVFSGEAIQAPLTSNSTVLL